MRKWVLGGEIKDRVQHQDQMTPHVHPYVSISREAGSGGGAIADEVARMLGLEVVDRHLLDMMAKEFNLPRVMLEALDEKASNWVLEVFGKWLNHSVVTQSEYVMHLGQIILTAARHGSKVFVGRGAQFLLPRDKGFRVQVIAPLEMRVRSLVDERKCGHDEAKTYLQTADQGRRDFGKRYFHRDVADAHLYDLVLNRERFEISDAAALIADQWRRRFG
jgi:cytidylate kinase